jgi:hypothetical protein
LTEDSAQAIVLDSREALVTKFAEAVSVALSAVLDGLRDPRSRLGDRARSLEVLAQQHQLLIGDPTQPTAPGPSWSPPGPPVIDDERARTLLERLRRFGP